MAEIKISEMPEQTNLVGVQAVGVKDSSPCRYDLGSVKSSIETALNGIIRPESQNTFVSSQNYYAGQFCTYGSTLYRFIATHWAGAWNGTDVVQTDLNKEVYSITASDYEALSAVVSFANADGTPNSHSISDINVSIHFDDGSSNTLTTGANGVAAFTIKKGLHYVLSAQEVDGFSKPVSRDITASLSVSSDGTTTYGGRIENLIYRVGALDTATVTTHIRVTGGGSPSAYNGLTACLTYPHGEYEVRSTLQPQSTTISYVEGASEATATFNAVKQGEFCSVFVPYLANYVQSEEKGFFVCGNTVDTYIDATYKDNFGMFYVDGTDFTEYRIEDYPSVTTSEGTSADPDHPCVAIHVNTVGLAKYGCDYYVKPISLTNQRGSTVASKQWCTANVVHPHVTYDYSGNTAQSANGKLATAYMMIDSNKIYAYSSPAAIWAMSQTLELNGRVRHGFIGTRVQWQPLFDASSEIDTALKFFGYAGQNYKTGTYWWSSCQYSATNAWYWNSGGYWYNGYNKTTNYTVLPFFCGSLT